MRPKAKRDIELHAAEFLESQHVQVASQGSYFNEKEEEGTKTIEVGKLLGMSFGEHETEIARRVMLLEEKEEINDFKKIKRRHRKNDRDPLGTGY
ncbi:hypothetical protein AAC387_Pa11g0433 [Persea americana]